MSSGASCSVCGGIHDELPFAFGAEAPDIYWSVPEGERSRRTLLSSDQCVVDDRHFYVRACLEVPIRDAEPGAVFSWGVWVSLSETNFERMADLWTDAKRTSEPPYFGWLSTRLPGYPETLNLKTNVHTRPVGERPFVELEPTDHPLAVEQREGITRDRARAIAEVLWHGGG
ncbi:MAG: DUF2199 domain-containing protein [Verrucomicrobiales bacterium]|nr:DUF2199 domain-containing protein [Verrucomicrobiales bacterium]